MGEIERLRAELANSQDLVESLNRNLVSAGDEIERLQADLRARRAEVETEADRVLHRFESEIRPLLDKDVGHGGGYDCCGCETYGAILDHAVRVVREETGAQDASAGQPGY